MHKCYVSAAITSIVQCAARYSFFRVLVLFCAALCSSSMVLNMSVRILLHILLSLSVSLSAAPDYKIHVAVAVLEGDVDGVIHFEDIVRKQLFSLDVYL